MTVRSRPTAFLRYAVLRRVSGPVLGAAAVVVLAAPAQAAPLPAPGDFDNVPSRTSLSFTSSTGVHVGTPNENESRPGLSTVKLYIADYALRRGDRSESDRASAQRMIQASDDWAASELDAKYPGAIDSVAGQYGLTSTSRGSFWGDSFTSTADTVSFLDAVTRTDPTSPVLGWMKTANPIAADGTVQDWGTARLASVTGSKWGWDDDGSGVVASASIGNGFTVAANTYGYSAAQTDDVLGALGAFDLASPPVGATSDVPSVLDVLLGIR